MVSSSFDLYLRAFFYGRVLLPFDFHYNRIFDIVGIFFDDAADLPFVKILFFFFFYMQNNIGARVLFFNVFYRKGAISCRFPFYA